MCRGRSMKRSSSTRSSPKAAAASRLADASASCARHRVGYPQAHSAPGCNKAGAWLLARLCASGPVAHSVSCRYAQRHCLADRLRSKHNALLYNTVLPWDALAARRGRRIAHSVQIIPIFKDLRSQERPRGVPARLQLVSRPRELHALAAAAEHGLDQQREADAAALLHQPAHAAAAHSRGTLTHASHVELTAWQA